MKTKAVIAAHLHKGQRVAVGGREGFYLIQSVERRGQIVACQDVIRVIGLIGPHTSPRLPPLVLTQLSGALVMAENEIKLLDSNVQKVVARLKAL